MSDTVVVERETLLKLVGLVALVDYPAEFAEELQKVTDKVREAIK